MFTRNKSFFLFRTSALCHHYRQCIIRPLGGDSEEAYSVGGGLEAARSIGGGLEEAWRLLDRLEEV